MSSSYIMNLLASAVAVIVGIVIHESAHAAAAWALGDKTARSRGRVSLNPLNHIDPFGTILLPLLMLAAGGPVFAFAKPVPVYLNNLKHPKRDEVLVSVAGPASNIALACLAAALMHATYGNLYTSMSFALASQIMNFGATFTWSTCRSRSSTSSRSRRSMAHRSSCPSSRARRSTTITVCSNTLCPSSSWCCTCCPCGPASM